jgi:hypothetical protein
MQSLVAHSNSSLDLHHYNVYDSTDHLSSSSSTSPRLALINNNPGFPAIRSSYGQYPLQSELHPIAAPVLSMRGLQTTMTLQSMHPAEQFSRLSVSGNSSAMSIHPLPFPASAPSLTFPVSRTLPQIPISSCFTQAPQQRRLPSMQSPYAYGGMGGFGPGHSEQSAVSQRHMVNAQSPYNPKTTLSSLYLQRHHLPVPHSIVSPSHPHGQSTILSPERHTIGNTPTMWMNSAQNTTSTNHNIDLGGLNGASPESHLQTFPSMASKSNPSDNSKPS